MVFKDINFIVMSGTITRNDRAFTDENVSLKPTERKIAY